MTDARVLFAGTPEFALASLQAMTNAGITPLAVLTQPDRPAGRGKRLTASPVKRFALDQGIEVLQPATLKDPDAVAQITAFNPDILVVAAYGLILPQNVLDIPAQGCLNVHASLLPRWRGAAPIQAAILAGDAETGVSLMAMTAGLDCGPVYVEEAIAIAPEETAGELHDRLAALGGELLVRHIGAILAGEFDAVEQDDARATYAGKIRKQDARLDWHRPAGELHRQVRAYNPVPGAFFLLDDMPVKCWRASIVAGATGSPGDVLSAGRDGVVIACGKDALRLDSLQRPGKRPVTAAEFAGSVAMTGRVRRQCGNDRPAAGLTGVSRDRQGARLRATAAEVVDGVVTSGRSLDAALTAHESRVAKDDRPLLRLLCYGTLRRHWRLQSWIAQLLDRPLKRRDSVINALLAIGLYQLTDTRIPDHAVVSQTVEASRLLRRPKLAGLLNAVMRRFLREDVAAAEPDTAEAIHDHPQWLIDAIRSDWPEHGDAILAANNLRAPMWLRVDVSRATTADYVQRLREAGLEATRFDAIEGAVKLAEPASVDELPGFSDGVVSVQDAGAQLAAPWLLAGGSRRVLDACAAPGGKSGHLLELGGAEIDLTCLDSDAKRLEAVAANLARLGRSATLVCADASTPQTWWDGTAFDAILLDAPCSASGVIRRHPDIKLLRRASDIASLAGLQRALLDGLWSLLAPGGRLLYVTCSVLAAENDEVVGPFLEATADAHEEDALQNNNIRDLMQRKAYGFQVLPGTADMDGFYYACLEKAG